MRLKILLSALMYWMFTAMVSVAMANPKGGKGGDTKGGGGFGAPEIDGPGGVAALALLVGAGLIVYNRYKK